MIFHNSLIHYMSTVGTSGQQESPPAWTKEAYCSHRATVLVLCSWEWGDPMSWPEGTPILVLGYPHWAGPGTVLWSGLVTGLGYRLPLERTWDQIPGKGPGTWRPWGTPLPVDRHTPVKTVPSPILRMRAVNMVVELTFIKKVWQVSVVSILCRLVGF